MFQRRRQIAPDRSLFCRRSMALTVTKPFRWRYWSHRCGGRFISVAVASMSPLCTGDLYHPRSGPKRGGRPSGLPWYCHGGFYHRRYTFALLNFTTTVCLTSPAAGGTGLCRRWFPARLPVTASARRLSGDCDARLRRNRVSCRSTTLKLPAARTASVRSSNRRCLVWSLAATPAKAAGIPSAISLCEVRPIRPGHFPLSAVLLLVVLSLVTITAAHAAGPGGKRCVRMIARRSLFKPRRALLTAFTISAAFAGFADVVCRPPLCQLGIFSLSPNPPRAGDCGVGRNGPQSLR